MEVGIDIVEVPRFQRAVERHGERLLLRLFTDRELAYARAAPPPLAVQRLAARFAAKEAFFKARGRPVPFRELEIVHRGRKPVLLFRGAPYPVSLSHTPTAAVAVVVIEGPTPR
jgi:holo-[acyl-carrier protein] synthase